jgi:hypothetical protein
VIERDGYLLKGHLKRSARGSDRQRLQSGPLHFAMQTHDGMYQSKPEEMLKVIRKTGVQGFHEKIRCNNDR